MYMWFVYVIVCRCVYVNVCVYVYMCIRIYIMCMLGCDVRFCLVFYSLVGWRGLFGLFGLVGCGGLISSRSFVFFSRSFLLWVFGDCFLGLRFSLGVF